MIFKFRSVNTVNILCSFHSSLIILLDISMDNTGFGGYFLYLVSLFLMHFSMTNLHLV